MTKDELGLGELVERLNAAYQEVAEWPEKRMPGVDITTLGEGFSDLLRLRNIVPEAADAITALIAERDALAKALRGLLRGEYESAEPGLCDCVDNHGKPYQSQFLAERIAAAETCLSTLNLTVNHDG